MSEKLTRFFASRWGIPGESLTGTQQGKEAMKNLMVILVDSTSQALRIEKILLKNEIACKMIPVPRHLSSDCGVCVRINAADWDRVKELLAAQKAIYRETYIL